MVVSAMAIPSLTSAMRSLQLAADARSIASALTYSKLSAISQMTRYRVTFDLEGNGWNLEKFNRTTDDFEIEQENIISSGDAESGIAFRSSSTHALTGLPSTSSSTITFNSRGIPVDEGGVPTANNVVYISKDDSEYAISVSLAGKVQVWNYDNNEWCSQ